MYLLKEDMFFKVHDFLTEQAHLVIAQSVVEGNTKGEIYVDKVDNPKSLLIMALGFTVTVCGKSDNQVFNKEVLSYIKDSLIPSINEMDMPFFEIYMSNSDWEQSFLNSFPNNYKANLKGLIVYTIEEGNGVNVRSSEHSSMIPLTKEVLVDGDLSNSEEILQQINMSWTSVEAFFKKGFGFGIVSDNQFVSWCLTFYSTENRDELVVVTKEDYQQKGYAKKVSAAAVNQSIVRGKQPIWTVEENNNASISLAKGIGLSFNRDYKVLQVSI